MTEAKLFLREYSGSPITRLIRDVVINEYWPCKYDLVVVNDIYDVIAHRVKTSEQAIAVALINAGARQLGKKTIRGAIKMLWAVRNVEKWESASDKELDKSYLMPTYDDFSKTEGYAGETPNRKKNTPDF